MSLQFVPAAGATDWEAGWARNKRNNDLRGVSSVTHVWDRAAFVDDPPNDEESGRENYGVSLYCRDTASLAQKLHLTWQIGDNGSGDADVGWGSDGEYFIWVHRGNFDAQGNYDEWEHQYGRVSTGEHSLGISQEVLGGVYWDAFLDGDEVHTFWYPYTNRNWADTLVEHGYGDDRRAPYFGRHESIRVRENSGTWYLQDDSRYSPPTIVITPHTPYFAFDWVYNYHYWRALPP
jgi:hypothetical protein